MSITREDLAAAAALGLLQYRQIDPLLVFLSQREVFARRRTFVQGAQAGGSATLVVLTLITGLLATVTGALFALLLATHDGFPDPNVLLFFVVAYLSSTCSAAALADIRGYTRPARLTSALLVASVPLGVYAIHLVA